MANDRNNFFKLSGKFDLPAYPGFIVMNIAISGDTRTCLPTNSTVMPIQNTESYVNCLICFNLLPIWLTSILDSFCDFKAS